MSSLKLVRGGERRYLHDGGAQVLKDEITKTKKSLVISLFTNTQNVMLKLQWMMVEPHLWETCAFSAQDTNSEACQLSLLPYTMFFSALIKIRVRKARKATLKEIIFLF